MQSMDTDTEAARQMLAEHPARKRAQIVLGLPDSDTARERIDQLIAALADGQPLVIGILDDTADTPFVQARLMECIDSGAARLLDKRQAVTDKGAQATLYLLEKA